MSSRRPDNGAAGDAVLAAALLAVDPVGLGGVVLRGAHGPSTESFLKLLREAMPVGAPFRRMPMQIGDGRLLGGLDLASTLQAGRPVFERGLLADAHGGVLVLPMAERLPGPTAARLCAVLDWSEVAVERDGFASRNQARLAMVALDESASDEERVPPALMDRLALYLDIAALRSLEMSFNVEKIASARFLLSEITADDSIVQVFCHAAMAVGIASIRAPSLALKVARAHAALAGRKAVNNEDALVASRLVLAPRATVLPVPPEEQQPELREPSTPETQDDAPNTQNGELEDVVLEAVRAAIPAHLLEQMQQASIAGQRPAAAGRAGAQCQSASRGRPAGVRRGELKAGARLNVVETLRAAAPWQKLRRQQAGNLDRRVRVRRDDFRVTRFKHQSESATIFVVDASGSSALHRLAEAKGAVELLLADCYVRRDQVALIAFRGKTADSILPPTRSLARAKRSLAALPGGGGTPLALAIDAAGAMADGLRRKGLAPTIVLLTDGRANVARDGAGGRERAEADALQAARACRALRFPALLVDTSPSPGPFAGRMAAEMSARYLALPRADAATISRVVRNATPVEPARAS